MSSVVAETAQVMAVMERVETLEDVVETFPPEDERRSQLLFVIASELEAAPPVRPVIAAQIINLSEKTVRNWAAHGLLTVSGSAGSGKSSRLLLDLQRIHEVKHFLSEARASDAPGSLIDTVHQRLVDATWADRDDLKESLRQMRAGEGEVRVRKPAS